MKILNQCNALKWVCVGDKTLRIKHVMGSASENIEGREIEIPCYKVYFFFYRFVMLPASAFATSSGTSTLPREQIIDKDDEFDIKNMEVRKRK